MVITKGSDVHTSDTWYAYGVVICPPNEVTAMALVNIHWSNSVELSVGSWQGLNVATMNGWEVVDSTGRYSQCINNVSSASQCEYIGRTLGSSLQLVGRSALDISSGRWHSFTFCIPVKRTN